MSDDLYLVWSNEHMGWWMPGGWGYSPALRSAGRYTRDSALRICREAIPTAAHIGLISEVPVRLADVEEFLFLSGQMIPAAIMDGKP